MSKKTFVDPKTGEEIESPAIARYISYFVGHLTAVGAVVVVLVLCVIGFGLRFAWFMLMISLISALVAWASDCFKLTFRPQREDSIFKGIHDTIARWCNQRPRMHAT